jgi:hypothetical protein
LFYDYTDGKQSLDQLAKKHQLSVKTIRSKLIKHNVIIPEHEPAETVIIMDTTYFRRNFGVMVFRDTYQKNNLHWRYVSYETIKLYKQGIQILKLRGWGIKAIVCDGRRGLFKAFPGIPMQMCHFHQLAIIRRYLTQNPRLKAHIELKQLSSALTSIDKESWVFALDQWHVKWHEYLKEKTMDTITGKWHYTHKKLRGAYNSLKAHTPYLFTFQDYPELKIPNTTNSLDGSFTNLKTKLRNHQGIKDHMKIMLTDHFLAK